MLGSWFIASTRSTPWLAGSVLFYLVLFLVFQVLVYTPLRTWWLAQILNLFGLWVYAPLPLLLLWAVAQSNMAGLLFLLLPLFAFVAEYGAFFVVQAANEPGRPLRIMTWNVYFVNEEVEAAATAILKEQPDLVLIQELGMVLAHGLSDRLRTIYPYQALAPSVRPDGFGIFSRHPFASAPQVNTQASAGRCQQVTILLDQQLVVILNTHPHVPDMAFQPVGSLWLPTRFDTRLQDMAIHALLQRVGASQQPLLLVGDFNMTDRQPNYRRLRAQLSDAFGEGGRGLGLTFPADVKIGPLPFFPVLRLDYIFHSQAWQTRRAWTGQAPGADHRYLVADLWLRP
jgi:endonuclease/exonuclease/phosphatase (EEP) superfamily protein YafD